MTTIPTPDKLLAMVKRLKACANSVYDEETLRVYCGEAATALEALSPQSAAGEGVWVPAEKLRGMQNRIDDLLLLLDKSVALNEKIMDGVRLLTQRVDDGWKMVPVEPTDGRG